MSVQAVSEIWAIAARIAGCWATVMDHNTLWRSRVLMSFQDQNPESARSVIWPSIPQRRRRATFVGETHDPTARSGGPFAHAGMNDLAGSGPGRQQRVIAKGFGVAVGCALLEVTVDLSNGGVNVGDGVEFGGRDRT